MSDSGVEAPVAKRARAENPILQEYKAVSVSNCLYTATCRHCGKKLVNVRPQRLECHIACVSGKGVAPCPKAPYDIKMIFKEKYEPSAAGSSVVRQGKVQGPLESCWKTIDIAECDKAIATFFYANRISFNVANSAAFKDMIRAIASKAPPTAYKLPSAYRLAQPLLNDQYKSTKQKVSPLCCVTNVFTAAPGGKGVVVVMIIITHSSISVSNANVSRR